MKIHVTQYNIKLYIYTSCQPGCNINLVTATLISNDKYIISVLTCYGLIKRICLDLFLFIGGG